MRADLHIHTTASDGCWSPEEVVAHVCAATIGLFAIADHDTLANVQHTADLARQAGLAFIPAAEVSAVADGAGIHVLAYGVDPTDLALNRMLEENTDRLTWINHETIRRLAQAGYPVDLQAYAAYQNDPSRGGWKGLNFLIDAGLCQDVHDFFDRLFVDPIRPPWPDFPHPAEVAEVIRAAGGLPVLAHPGHPLLFPGSMGLSEETLAPLLGFGIAGLECYASHHDLATTRTCLEFCARHDLLVTGGSDCHGGFAGRQLGVPAVDTADLRLGPLEEYLVHGP